MGEQALPPWFLQIGYFFRYGTDDETRFFVEGELVPLPVEDVNQPLFMALNEGCIYFYKGHPRAKAEFEEINAAELELVEN